MRLIAVFCVALGACASPAGPAFSAGSGQSTLEGCLVASQDDQGRRSCISRMTNACIEGDDAMATTAGMVRCAEAERAAWNVLRTRYIAELLSRETGSQTALLDALIAEHPQWVQARCAYAASTYEGGSLARFVGASCMRDAEAELTIELHSRLRDEP